MRTTKTGCTAAVGASVLLASLLGAGSSSAAPRPASPESVASTVAHRYAAHEGIGAGTLRLDRSVDVPGGRAVHFQQYVAGRPVIGAQVVVQLDSRGRSHGVDGTVSPAPARRASPRQSTATAESKARSALARQGADRVRSSSDATTSLAWYDASILAGRPSSGRLTLVHDVTVTPRSTAAIGGRVLVDASTGAAVLTVTSKREATNRRVCDARNAYISNLDCPSPVRVEGGAATGQADVDAAYARLGASSAFYANRFGYDLISRIGSGALRATVRACYRDDQGDYGCPMENAFWTGRSMVFGAGFTSADDVVTHELAHGVTDQTAGLVYRNESGAINESMSDVFGELEDLSNGTGTDTAAARWLLGEDLPGGAIRDMKTPSRGSQPSIYKGSGWTTDPQGLDNGGVHTNSGVGNKAAFLITDGQTFNGQTVRGLGTAKAEQLYWRVQNSLTSAATYAQLGRVLNSSCSALASSATAGITTSDCQQVSKAVIATKM